MKILCDGPLVVDGELYPKGAVLTVEKSVGERWISRGVARHALPPDILHETNSREQDAALREQGVTCLCLTRNRREWLPKAIASYLAQSYGIRELLIVADGEDIRDLVPDRPDIRLIHVEEGRTIGDKRNFGVSQARGKYVAHWDDDDWSAPDRLLEQGLRLRLSGLAVTGYHQFDFNNRGQWWRYQGDEGYGPGSTLLYERDWALRHPFPALQIGEDGRFCETAREFKQIVTSPSCGMLTASIHISNTSPRNLGNEVWTRLERSGSGLTVIIPSRKLSNVGPCVEAVRRLNPEVRIVVVDDGVENVGSLGVDVIPGINPFIFARNMNAGIRFAGLDDVLLLNDDAILETPRGFSLLQECARNYPEFGVIAATTNAVGNRNQLPMGAGLREDPRMVCFVAALIPRATLEKIGYLDERFNAYGFEDDDFCYRVRRAGLKIGILDDCFVDHASLESTFRGEALAGGNLEGGRRIFEDKWGAYPL
jgi:glycosyltransferase involved in cell wall biosynthesis